MLTDSAGWAARLSSADRTLKCGSSSGNASCFAAARTLSQTPLLALLHQQCCAAPQRRLLARSLAPTAFAWSAKPIMAEIFSGIIDHRRLAYLNDATRLERRSAYPTHPLRSHATDARAALGEISRKIRRPAKSLPSCFCRGTQFCRDLQDLDDHRDGDLPPRTGCHEILFGSRFIVRADRRCRTMPKPTILILDDRRERGVNPLAGLQGRRIDESRIVGEGVEIAPSLYRARSAWPRRGARRHQLQ
jgi:hypothetical protein